MGQGPERGQPPTESGGGRSGRAVGARWVRCDGGFHERWEHRAAERSRGTAGRDADRANGRRRGAHGGGGDRPGESSREVPEVSGAGSGNRQRREEVVTLLFAGALRFAKR